MRSTDETGTGNSGGPKKVINKELNTSRFATYSVIQQMYGVMLKAELPAESTLSRVVLSWMNVDANGINQIPVRTCVETDDTTTTFHIHRDAESISFC